MPLMSGRMFYIPCLHQNYSIFGELMTGLDNPVGWDFLPPYALENEFYCTANDGVTGQSVGYQIIGGNNGTFPAIPFEE